MSVSTPPFLPPTLTPIFDAGNRWVAIRANLPPGATAQPELLTLLFSAMTSADDDAVTMPLLIEGDDPRRWARMLTEVPPSSPIHLLFPSACFADTESQPALAEFENLGVTLLAYGVPTAPSAQAIGIDVAQGLNGHGNVLATKGKGPHLAIGVGNPEIYRACRQAGFHWFEGAWALHPEPDHGPQTTTSRSTLMNLLGLVAGDADSHEIETLLKHDPNLSYQLLRLVNSVSFSLSHKISSFNQAITLLGRRQLQRWLQLLMYAGHHAEGGGALLGLAAHRAALMEALVMARGGGQDDKDRAFMIGLFSLLPVLFNASITDLVTPLNLEQGVERALIAHEGTLGQLLDLAISAEARPGENFARLMAELAVAPDAFVQAQHKAVAWAAQVCREI